MRTAWSWTVSLLVYFLTGCSPLISNSEGWFSTNSVRSKEAKSESSASYNFLLAELELKNKNYDKALEYYQKSLEFDSGTAAGVRKRIVEISLRTGNVEQALEQIDKIGKEADSDPELLRLKAGMLATQKKFDEAIDVYNKLLVVSPGLDEETNIFLASLYAQKGDFNSAKKVIEKVLATQPQSIFAKYYMAKILLGLNDYKNSEKYFKQVLQAVPLIEPAYLDLARLYVYQKRVPEAISTLELLVNRSPSNKAARSLLGELLLGEERSDEAIREFKALEEIQDDPSDTRVRIAVVKLQQRDFEGAEVDLKLILLNNPKNTIARYYLANAYAGQKRPDSALEQVSKIKAKDQYFLESRMLAIFILKQENKNQEAVNFLDDLLTQSPNDIKLRLLKSNLLKESGDLDGAIEIMQELVDQNIKDDGYLFTLAVLEDENDNKDRAIKLLEKCIELNPVNANALNYLGYSYVERNEKLVEARQFIERALALEPDNGYFLDSLGWAYYKMKDFKSAEREMEKAVAIVSEDAVILEHMGIIYAALSDKKAANAVWTKALELAPESDDKEVEDRLREHIKSLSDE